MTARLATDVRPVRLQLSRKRGFNLQELSRATNGLPAAVVTRRSALGNPFIVGIDGTREECCYYYALMLGGMIFLTCKASVDAQGRCLKATIARLPTLKNTNIACSCRFDGKPCHGGIVLLRANLTHERYCELGLKDKDTLLAASANPRILLELANGESG